jgi:hypothetical protein
MSATTAAPRTLTDRALEILRRAGNPFRNYFARNPDDEVCARYHVPELFARERSQLLGVVDLYRYDPTTHSEMVPILGNKGAGKTHLLYSIKHGESGAWQMLVTPGVYQKDTDFLEYLLFQVIDTLLGGGKQRGTRPLEFIGEELVRRLFQSALQALSPTQRLELFPAPGLGRWARKLGLGGTQAQERAQWLLDGLSRPVQLPLVPGNLRRACEEAGMDPARACAVVCTHIDRTEAHNTAGLMRSNIYQGFARAAFLGDEADLASFLTYGFAELEFHVRPTRQDLVLALFKVLMEVFRSLRVPVVAAFDQLEDLLLSRRSDDAHRIAEAFFAGIVQVMHQVDGICFLIFAERGLWNRFVPSLDGYIQDRLNNPVHVPQFGTIQALRLESPPAELVRRVVEARLRPQLEELSDAEELPRFFPFTQEQIDRIARTEPTLRDMLQQYRHLFDHLVYGPQEQPAARGQEPEAREETLPEVDSLASRLPAEEPPVVKSVVIVETPGESQSSPEPGTTLGQGPAAANSTPSLDAPASTTSLFSDRGAMLDLWDQEVRSARRRLEPEGALTGATRDIQAGLGLFLQTCHDHGVKVGPWRLHHVVPEWTFGDHPTYGALAIAHWVCKDGQPWKVGIGLFLGRGVAKPKDLSIKLSALEVEPPVIDHLILLRPEDDLSLTGKSKSLWQEAEKRGRHARLEALTADSFALLSSLPRWLNALTETLPAGHELPNLADLIQDRCERLLEQVCLPVAG